MVNRWFCRRTLLIGDAAHVFPPFGGQRIASGIRDAQALAWRLALLSQINATASVQDKFLAGWANERRQMVDHAARLTRVNGSITNLHPGVGFPLECYVPQDGLDVGNFHIPAGTIVEMNAWVVHRDRTVYGEDAASFVPERRIDVEPEQLKLMERCFFSVCMKNIIYPLLA